MSRLYIPNFDFEYQLGRARNYQANLQLKQINEEMKWSLLSLISEGDGLLSESKPDPEFLISLLSAGFPIPELVRDPNKFNYDEMVPWGWSETIEKLDQSGTSHPSTDVIRKVNSRAYSYQLEQEWNIGLAGSLEFDNLETLKEHLDSSLFQKGSWIIKSELAMSGRERLTGQGHQLDENQSNWIQKRIQAGQKLYLEPEVRILSEAGIQFTIPEDGEPVLEGVVPLISHHQGGYLGSVISRKENTKTEWKTSIDCAVKAAERIQSEGYWGPLGIDAALYQSNEEKLERPLQDINARWTMGRCALEFRKHLEDNETGLYLHLSGKNPDGKITSRLESFRSTLNQEERILQLSPSISDETPNRVIMLLVIASEEIRCREILEQLQEL